MTAGFEMGENLGELVAHHRAEHHMGQACLAQVDEVAEADVQQVGEFLFSQPACGWGRCIGAHACDHRVNLVMPCASSLRNEDGHFPILSHTQFKKEGGVPQLLSGRHRQSA